jgi:Tannase and feruloyl esterase
MRFKRYETASKLMLVGFAAALMGTAAFVPAVAVAKPLPTCSALAAQLLTNGDILAATSAVQAAVAGPPANASYCLVNITVSDLSGPKDGYQPGQKQMINIGIGLPLSAADGGSGGVEGNWNGRIENLGGGGYAGTVGPVTGATNSGYAGSSTDTGHPASAGGTFALNPNDTLNWGLINDFAFNGIHEQTIWTKKLTQMYYGTGPKYTYWNGCSTGGRQGHEQAQRFPDDYDGILAGASAFNWDRFIVAEQWGEVVMNVEVGAPIVQAKLDAVSQAVLAACDPLDGIADGVIQDPRACLVDANAYVCGEPGAASLGSNCLTPKEAGAMNKIWNGPPGKGADQQLWFGLERGAFLDGLDGVSPFIISTQYLQYWVFQNPAFDWHTLTEKTFDQAFKDSELKFREVIGTDNPDLSQFKQHGGKMITYHGLADFLIMPRGTYNYYNNVTKAQGGLTEVQKFYRFFPYPGNSHCGGTMFQPNAPLINGTDLFNALVDWVEHGVAPDFIVASNAAGGTRPICKYPDTLVYNGTGSTFSATNFHCQHQTADELMAAEIALPDPGKVGP